MVLFLVPTCLPYIAVLTGSLCHSAMPTTHTLPPPWPMHACPCQLLPFLPWEDKSLSIYHYAALSLPEHFLPRCVCGCARAGNAARLNKGQGDGAPPRWYGMVGDVGDGFQRWLGMRRGDKPAYDEQADQRTGTRTRHLFGAPGLSRWICACGRYLRPTARLAASCRFCCSDTTVLAFAATPPYRIVRQNALDACCHRTAYELDLDRA